MTTAAFFDKCDSIDWFGNFSDDHNVAMKSHDDLKALRAEARGTFRKAAILDAFIMWRDESFGRGKATVKPQAANWRPLEAPVEIHDEQLDIFDIICESRD